MQAIVIIGVAFVREIDLSGVTLPPRPPLGAIAPGRATAVLLPIQPAIATTSADPIKELHHAVDLVVVTAVGEGEELVFELGHPVAVGNSKVSAADGINGRDSHENARHSPVEVAATPDVEPDARVISSTRRL